jgi:ABC-2 type transport system permease protein
MRTFFILLSKELRAFFLSPVAWVVLCLFMVITGWSFSFSIGLLQEKPSDFSIVRWTFFPQWFWYYYFFLFPLITMRLFAEEQRQGTLESLLTAPVTTAQVLLAKYTSALIFYCVLWLPALLYFGLLHWIMRGKVEIPLGALGGSYLILFATGLFHLAIGCLASSLTKNQIIAAILGYALILLHFLAGTSLMYLSQDNPDRMRPILDQAVTMRHMDYFTLGLIDTRPLAYYLSGSIIILMVTHQILEYRRWKT